MVLVHEVERDRGKLQRCAALHEDDLVVVRDIHDLAQLRFGLHDDIIKHFGAVAHFHDGHAAAFKVDEIVPRAFEHFQRKHGRAGREIVDPVVKHYEFSCSFSCYFLMRRCAGKSLRILPSITNYTLSPQGKAIPKEGNSMKNGNELTLY